MTRYPPSTLPRCSITFLSVPKALSERVSVILNQILHKLRVAEVDGARVVLVELGDGGHIVGGQREVEDVEILRHTFFVTGLGDGHNTTLGQPPEGHLSGTFAILGTYGGKLFTLHDAIDPLSAKRSPSHHTCAEFCKYRLDGCLLYEGVALQLVHHRLYIHIVGEVEETARLEVAHSYGAHLAVVIGFLHRPPRAEHVAVRLMDEQQVDVIRLQLAQALVDALGCLFLSVVRNPHLCHEEKLLAFQATFAPGVTHALFVGIRLCRVYQPVADAQRIADTTLALGGRHLKDAVTQQGHFHSV